MTLVLLFRMVLILTAFRKECALSFSRIVENGPGSQRKKENRRCYTVENMMVVFGICRHPCVESVRLQKTKKRKELFDLTGSEIESIKKQNASELEYAQGVIDQGINGRKGTIFGVNNGHGWQFTIGRREPIEILGVLVRAKQNGKTFVLLDTEHLGGFVFIDNSIHERNFAAVTDYALKPILSCNCKNTVISLAVVAKTPQGEYLGFSVHSQSDSTGERKTTRSYAHDFGDIEDLVHQIGKPISISPGPVRPIKLGVDPNTTKPEEAPPKPGLSNLEKAAIVATIAIGIIGTGVSVFKEWRLWKDRKKIS